MESMIKTANAYNAETHLGIETNPYYINPFRSPFWFGSPYLICSRVELGRFRIAPPRFGYLRHDATSERKVAT